MSALALALTYRRLVRDSGTLRLLRADHVAAAAALLSTHLGSPGARLPADDLHELVDADLEELRDHFELGSKSAKAYCDDWRSAGLLVRRPAPESRGETYELSPEAIDGLRILHELDEPRSTVTESRLVGLMAAVHQLAIDTDTDVTRRVEALRAERDRIDAEIARLSGGDVDVLDGRRALERVTDVLLQARDLPADFARVRARFEELNHDLRASIVNADAAQSAVLDDVFRGVDLIESSDEGRTFSAFSALIRDPERSATFDVDVTDILDREFARALPPEARRTLRTLVRELKNGSREVHGVLTEFARGLRRYVHSQEFQRDRAMRRALQEALAAAIPASRQTRPYREVGLDLELSAMRLTSVGETTPHDPTEFDTGSALLDEPPGTVDLAALAALARETEIDYPELVRNVNAVMASTPAATVGDVLGTHPATQGVASVVGLLSLATRHGQVRGEESEELGWQGVDGGERRARVATHVFTQEVDA
ncbi:DUF3375 domain-containing protein [Agilicoccus flavus]|uniref:DUF3375 domain-containing protein n=1 Tax=Agilicoccus flavus TaxID=2775968 RepID=UPI001CF70A6E|nr:DUF3375 domain-containing protein [Agilicoccus flavus]